MFPYLGGVGYRTERPTMCPRNPEHSRGCDAMGQRRTSPAEARETFHTYLMLKSLLLSTVIPSDRKERSDCRESRNLPLQS